MLNVRVQGAEALINRLEHIASGKKSALARALTKAAIKIESSAKREGFTGRPRLQSHAGSAGLAGSITHFVDASALRAVVGTNKIYARIHEFGGTIKPVRARMLAWQTDGEWHFAKQVTIPPRPYLGPALKSNRPAVEKLMAGEVDALLGGK